MNFKLCFYICDKFLQSETNSDQRAQEATFHISYPHLDLTDRSYPLEHSFFPQDAVFPAKCMQQNSCKAANLLISFVTPLFLLALIPSTHPWVPLVSLISHCLIWGKKDGDYFVTLNHHCLGPQVSSSKTIQWPRLSREQQRQAGVV